VYLKRWPTHSIRVETLEELSDVGAFVILAPTPQERIKPRNQFLGFSKVSRKWQLVRLPRRCCDGESLFQSCRPIDIPLRQSTAVVFNPIKFCSCATVFGGFRTTL
jgi:hypothetical protein